MTSQLCLLINYAYRIAVMGQAAAFKTLKSTLLYNNIRNRVDITPLRPWKMEDTMASVAEVVGRVAAGTHIIVETQPRVRWLSCKGRTMIIQFRRTR